MPETVIYWQAYFDIARFIQERVYTIGPTQAQMELAIVLRHMRDEVMLRGLDAAGEGRLDAMLDAVS